MGYGPVALAGCGSNFQRLFSSCVFLLERRQILKKINRHIFCHIYLFIYLFIYFMDQVLLTTFFLALSSLTHVQQVVGISYK